MAKGYKSKDIKEFVLVLATIVLVAYLSSFVFFRIDLTSERRYTLSRITKQTLRELPDLVHVRVYLDGELPMGFNRMRKSLKETLEEFHIYGERNFHYQFIDPSASPNQKERDDFYRDLYSRGLEPTSVQERDTRGGSSQTIIFPSAIVSYRGNEVALNLLKNNQSLSGDENINLSVQAFEFAMLNAIKMLTQEERPKLAFIHGHGELDEYQTGDIAKELSTQYEVHRAILGGEVGGLEPYAAVILAGPSQSVSEADKLVLDQYIMNGGRVLWFIDAITISIDSLSKGSTTLAFPNNHNLDDLLFRYGVRVNPSVIQDMQCATIPINVSLAGQDPRFAPVPWVFYPLFSTPLNHPITRNVNLVYSRFVSPIDTVGANGGIAKTVLLRSSANSRLLNVPLFVNLRQIEQSPLERDFNRRYLPTAMLLEGSFESPFQNRILKSFNNGNPFTLKEKGVYTRMIVVSDADIIRNDVTYRTDGAYVTPLGFDRFTNKTFGNKELIVNMVNYLTDDLGLMSLRSREFKLRLLDRKKILAERSKWQLINMTVPSAIMILFALIWVFVRKRRYAR
jgi:gliding-associated putative ABC transporter substrate-binding component GldG